MFQLSHFLMFRLKAPGETELQRLDDDTDPNSYSVISWFDCILFLCVSVCVSKGWITWWQNKVRTKSCWTYSANILIIKISPCCTCAKTCFHQGNNLVPRVSHLTATRSERAETLAHTGHVSTKIWEMTSSGCVVTKTNQDRDDALILQMLRKTHLSSDCRNASRCRLCGY